MIKRMYIKSFAKLEAKKRVKLGDKAFLEKYIRTYTRLNKMIKVCLPILMIVFALLAAFNTAAFYAAHTDKYFFLFQAILYFITFLLWIFCAIVYYTHHFKFHDQKINEWKIELNKINGQQAQV